MARKRKPKKPKNNPKKRKAGDAYQDAVGTVARALAPASLVEVGEWIEGPDGERDMDVSVWTVSKTGPPLILIECKDCTRPVGIGVIDALESKRRDLKVGVAMVCSNSGYSAEALRKGARVGIPMLAALIAGDSRIRVEVQEELAARRITITKRDTRLHFQQQVDLAALPKHLNSREWAFQGSPIDAWTRDQCRNLISRAVRSRRILIKNTFREPIEMHVLGVTCQVSGLDQVIEYEVQWCSQIIRIDSSSGMYDYLRKRVVMGPGQNQYILRNVGEILWIPMAEMPPDLPIGPLNVGPNPLPAMIISVAIIHGLDMVDDIPAPELNPLVAKCEVADQDNGRVLNTDGLLWD